MTEKCRHPKWPEQKNHPFNALMRMFEYFEDEPDVYLSQFGNPDYRLSFLNALRPYAASMIRLLLNAEQTRLRALATAAEFIAFTNAGEFMKADEDKSKNEFHFTDDQKMLHENQKHFTALAEETDRLFKTKQKK
jgi:hypothetical protein